MVMKYMLTSGKRKTAIARAIIRPGAGRIRINLIPLEIYEPRLVRERIREALILAGNELVNQVDIDVKVKGGGFMSQASAARTAIANALLKWAEQSEEFEAEILKRRYIEYDRHMLVGDSRRREPKKWGGPGARARFQKSYR